MNIFIITIISFISFMVYFFIGVGSYRLFMKIRPPEGYYASDIQVTNCMWAAYWPIFLPFALIYILFTTKLVEDIFVKCGEGFEFFLHNIVVGFFINTYKFYNKVIDKVFRGVI